MSFETVHNYYEKQVFDEILIQASKLELPLPPDSLEDAACLALNKLPPRYVRYEVDTTFFLSSEERAAIYSEVTRLVSEALSYVKNNPKSANE